ncbi:MAG: hypothetical protein QNJ40_23610 [Xanthomonadales bacterium]|nr:hypothetical protein [Xanthomonadales bacterium]
MNKLTGHWLGVYWQSDRPTRFDMDLTELDGIVTGIIRDHGPLGSATLSGNRSSTGLRFQKRYLVHLGRIDYQGSLSSDGLTLTGRWWFPNDYGRPDPWSGTWQAERDPGAVGREEVEIEDCLTPEESFSAD